MRNIYINIYIKNTYKYSGNSKTVRGNDRISRHNHIFCVDNLVNNLAIAIATTCHVKRHRVSLRAVSS